jgi:hypothetical protein
LYFILISIGCISAGILWFRYSEKDLFDFLLPANILVVLLSLFSILTNIPSDSWTGGHGKGFIGFFGHQNLLASVLLFTLPSVCSKLWRPKNIEHQLPLKAYSLKLTAYYLPLTAYCLLLTANLLFIILTYSRSALLALILGIIVFLILNKNWKVLSFSFITAAFLAAIIYLIPSVNQFADKILKKDFPEVYSSRLWMWEPSYRAAINGGLIGLGYGVSDPKEKVGGMGDHYEDGRFIREKGNSTLALIEESGLIGLVLFLLPIIYLLIKIPDTRYQVPDEKILSGIGNPTSGIQHSVSSIKHPVSSILFASIAAFVLHAQFEAWWVGVGSVQLPLFFIYFGLIVQGSNLNSYIVKA